MFKRALIDGFKWSTKWYLGSFSTAIATFFFFNKYLEFDTIRSIRYGVALFFVSFLVKTIIQYVKLIDHLETKIEEKDQQIEILNSRKERKKQLSVSSFYGESIIILKEIFSNFHYLRKHESIERKQMMTSLIYLCNGLKELFEKRFNHNYSICIKVLGPDSDLENLTVHAEVITLCRDEKSYKRRSVPNGIKHNIFDNTCFNEIFHNIDNTSKSYYLNNDIVEDKYYKNTSFNIYGELPNDCHTTEERRKNWTLPYKSELVVPITPVTTLANTERKKQFLGYLCVDCNETDSFHNKYDVEMLKGVADGIFDIIKHSYKKQ